MMHLNPLVLVGAVIGVITALLVAAYAAVKDKKHQINEGKAALHMLLVNAAHHRALMRHRTEWPTHHKADEDGISRLPAPEL